MERIPPITEAITRTLVEVLMMWVVASLTGIAGLGDGVGLASRIAGNMDEENTTSPGPPIGGEIANGVASMKARVGVGVTPPWPGEPGAVP